MSEAHITIALDATTLAACAEREAAMRRRVYPRWVESGRMTPGKAAAEIKMMEAIAAHFRALGLQLEQDWQPTHQHRKGGLYRVITRGSLEADLTPAVVYDDAEGRVWIRPAADFDDGRFTPLSGGVP